MKRTRLIVGVLMISVALLVSVGSIMLLRGSNSNQGTTLKQTANNANSEGYAGPVSFQIEGSYATDMDVAIGSAAQGTIVMNVIEADPLLIFYYNGAASLNGSSAVLPPGISVSLDMYGNPYDVPSINEVAFNSSTFLPLSTVQLLPTTLGETSIQYTIRVASTVPAGAYTINIIFWPILKGDSLPSGASYWNIDMMYGHGAQYPVTLNVQ